MAQVFISYSSADTKYAETVVNYLESHGISCWLAHREITIGSFFADAIPHAIRECPAFMILISKNSITSENVVQELTLAAHKTEKMILPLILEDISLSPSFSYFLINRQLYQYYKYPSATLEQVVRELRQILPDSSPRYHSKKATAAEYLELADHTSKAGESETSANWYRKATELLRRQKTPSETKSAATKPVQDPAYYKGMEFYCKGLECYIAVDYASAAEWFRMAADLGYDSAMFYLGFCYHFGYGIPVDIPTAVKWYQKAADRGYAQAQFYLAACHEQGNGIPQNLTTAVKWYREAAEQGHAQAQYALGVCCENGNGIRKNPENAVKWYQKAADQGHTQSQYALGVCYEKGNGVPQNYKIAVSWYQKAADQDYARAQYALGVCYEKGNGVQQNQQTAVILYTKAAEQGLDVARLKIEKLRVFISYSSIENRYANEILEALESQGIRCWIAPRDVPIGFDYMTSIPDGIENSSFFVLVLSETSQNSVWVRKELSQAIKQRKEIFPLKIENCTVNKSFEFALDNIQIRDYYLNKASVIQEVLTSIKEHSSQDSPMLS